MKNPGKVIIIVAPSGTGKSTLLKMLFQEFTDLKWSVSTTTRAPRAGEVDGKDYFFSNKGKFLEGIQNQEFVEWALVHSNYYGTSKVFMDQCLKEGQFIVCDIDVQGADRIKDMYQDQAQAIFIEPPSIDDLKQRLIGRATDSIDVIKERLQNAERELMRKNDYDYLVRNEDLDNAFMELKVIFSEIMNI